MPIAKHVSLLVDRLNSSVWAVPDSEKLLGRLSTLTDMTF